MSEALEYLSEIQDLIDLHEFMEDEHLAYAMNLALKVLAKPEEAAKKSATLVVKFEALAFKFGMMGQTYMTIKNGKAGTDENKKKNVYFSARDRCHEMSAALKYMAKGIDL